MRINNRELFYGWLWGIALFSGFAITAYLFVMTMLNPAIGMQKIALSALVAMAYPIVILLFLYANRFAIKMIGQIQSVRFFVEVLDEFMEDAGKLTRLSFRLAFTPLAILAMVVALFLFVMTKDSNHLANAGYFAIYGFLLAVYSFAIRYLFPIAGIDYL